MRLVQLPRDVGALSREGAGDEGTSGRRYPGSAVRHSPAGVQRGPAARFVYVLVAALVMVAFCTGEVNGQDAGDGPFAPVIGYSSTVFVDVDMDDAKTVTKLWSDMVVKKRGGKAETKIYQDLSDIERNLKAGNVDLVALVANEFLELRTRAPIEPLMVSSREKYFYEELVLLVRKDSGIKTLKDLKGKVFIIQKGQYAVVHFTWLETLLMREGVHDTRQFFSSIRDARKPSQAIMPVFFKQADACIMTRRGFDIMAELNPQLRSELTVLDKSPQFAGGVIVVRKGYPERHKRTMAELLVSLHDDPQGKQLLTLFRMDKLIPYKAEYITTMEGMFREHKDLKVRLASRR